VRIRQWVCFFVSLYLFLLALELIKAGAADLKHVALDTTYHSFLGFFGMGWLLACVFLSGSPVAAIALGLLGATVLSTTDSFAMIMGSRIGASFVVLVIGFVYDLRSRAPKGGVYVGALALLTTASVYLPALGIGYAAISMGFFDGLSLHWEVEDVQVLQAAFHPALHLVDSLLPAWGRVLLGVALMLGAFKLFDAVLPAVDPTGGKLGQMANTIYRPPVAFLFGMLVTSITLSVSVSLALLVPLTVRGIVRRENLVPYILGANITTFIDTLAAALMVGHEALPVVVCAVTVVSVISVPIVFFAYRPYERMVDATAAWVTANTYRLGLLVLLLFAVPLVLIFVSYVGR
jgi:Na+/phosphate symporter